MTATTENPTAELAVVIYFLDAESRVGQANQGSGEASVAATRFANLQAEPRLIGFAAPPGVCATSTHPTLVLHPHQKQSLRRGGGAGGLAVGRPEDLAGPGLGPAAAADFDQRADDRPHHVVKEPVGLDLDDNEVVGMGARPPATPLPRARRARALIPNPQSPIRPPPPALPCPGGRRYRKQCARWWGAAHRRTGSCGSRASRARRPRRGASPRRRAGHRRSARHNGDQKPPGPVRHGSRSGIAFAARG